MDNYYSVCDDGGNKNAVYHQLENISSYTGRSTTTLPAEPCTTKGAEARIATVDNTDNVYDDCLPVEPDTYYSHVCTDEREHNTENSNEYSDLPENEIKSAIPSVYHSLEESGEYFELEPPSSD